MSISVNFDTAAEATEFFSNSSILGGIATTTNQMPYSIEGARAMIEEALSNESAFVIDTIANQPATLNDGDKLYSSFDVSGPGRQSAVVVRVTTSQQLDESGYVDRFSTEATTFVFPMSYSSDEAISVIQETLGTDYVNPSAVANLRSKLS